MDIKLNTLMKFSHIPGLEFQYIGHIKLPENLSDTAHPYENRRVEHYNSNCSVLRSGDQAIRRFASC